MYGFRDWHDSDETQFLERDARALASIFPCSSQDEARAALDAATDEALAEVEVLARLEALADESALHSETGFGVAFEEV